MVAYHSVLVFNVLGVSGFDLFDVPKMLPVRRVATGMRFRNRCATCLTVTAEVTAKNFRKSITMPCSSVMRRSISSTWAT